MFEWEEQRLDLSQNPVTPLIQNHVASGNELCSTE